MPDEKCILDPERDCIGKAAAIKLEARIDALEKWQEDSKKFHNTFYDWQREQIARDAKLDEQLSNMNKNIEKLLVKQEVCDAKPAKRWESVVAAAISAIVSGLVVFLLTRVGLQ